MAMFRRLALAAWGATVAAAADAGPQTSPSQRAITGTAPVLLQDELVARSWRALSKKAAQSASGPSKIAGAQPENADNPELANYKLEEPGSEKIPFGGQYCRGGGCQYREPPPDPTFEPTPFPAENVYPLHKREFCTGLSCIPFMGHPPDGAPPDSWMDNCGRLFDFIAGGMDGADGSRTLDDLETTVIRWCEARVPGDEAGNCPGYADIFVLANAGKYDQASIGGTGGICASAYKFFQKVNKAEIDLRLTKETLPGAASLLSVSLNKFGTGGVGPESKRGRKWKDVLKKRGFRFEKTQQPDNEEYIAGKQLESDEPTLSLLSEKEGAADTSKEAMQCRVHQAASFLQSAGMSLNPSVPVWVPRRQKAPKPAMLQKAAQPHHRPRPAHDPARVARLHKRRMHPEAEEPPADGDEDEVAAGPGRPVGGHVGEHLPIMALAHMGEATPAEKQAAAKVEADAVADMERTAGRVARAGFLQPGAVVDPAAVADADDPDPGDEGAGSDPDEGASFLQEALNATPEYDGRTFEDVSTWEIPKYKQNPPCRFGVREIPQSEVNYVIDKSVTPPTQITGDLLQHCSAQFKEIMGGYTQTTADLLQMMTDWCKWQGSTTAWIGEADELGHPDWSTGTCKGMLYLVTVAMKDSLNSPKGIGAGKVCKNLFLTMAPMHRIQELVHDAWTDASGRKLEGGLMSLSGGGGGADAEAMRKAQEYAQAIFGKMREQRDAFKDLNDNKMDTSKFENEPVEAGPPPAKAPALPSSADFAALLQVASSHRITDIRGTLSRWGKKV